MAILKQQLHSKKAKINLKQDTSNIILLFENNLLAKLYPLLV